MGVGEKLRDARIALGYSIEDIQKQTRIQIRYLEAIENDQFELLPGKLYAKLFVRQYANIVNVNVDDFMEHNDLSHMEVGNNENNLNPETINKVKEKTKKNKNPLLNIALKLVFVVFSTFILGVVAYMSWIYAGRDKTEEAPSNVQVTNNINNDERTDETNGQTNDDNENLGASDVQVAGESTQQLKVSSIQGKTTVYEMVDYSDFVVTIKASGLVWVRVEDETGTSHFESTMNAGQIQEIDLSNIATSAVVQLGNTNNVEIYVNDELLTYAIDPLQRSVQEIIIKAL